MKVTRLQVVARGLTNRCPNCGQHTIFRKGTLFKVNASCPNCGLPIDRDEGFFLGSMSLNYGVTVVCFLVPIMALAYNGVIGSRTALSVGICVALIMPALLYRSSRSWWLMNYYFVLPQQLPANKSGVKSSD